MTLFNLPEIWKRRTLLIRIRDGISNTYISDCLGVNLRIGQRIPKEFDESNVDYDGSWKVTLRVLMRKELPYLLMMATDSTQRATVSTLRR